MSKVEGSKYEELKMQGIAENQAKKEALGLSKLVTIFKDIIQKAKKKDKRRLMMMMKTMYLNMKGDLDQILQVKITRTTNMMSLLLQMILSHGKERQLLKFFQYNANIHYFINK